MKHLVRLSNGKYIVYVSEKPLRMLQTVEVEFPDLILQGIVLQPRIAEVIANDENFKLVDGQIRALRVDIDEFPEPHMK